MFPSLGDTYDECIVVRFYLHIRCYKCYSALLQVIPFLIQNRHLQLTRLVCPYFLIHQRISDIYISLICRVGTFSHDSLIKNLKRNILRFCNNSYCKLFYQCVLLWDYIWHLVFKSFFIIVISNEVFETK